MPTVEEFVHIRKQIELLIKQVTLQNERKVALDSTAQKVEEAGELLATLKTMIDNDVQESCVGRLTGELARVQARAESLARSKRPAQKRPRV